MNKHTKLLGLLIASAVIVLVGCIESDKTPRKYYTSDATEPRNDYIVLQKIYLEFYNSELRFHEQFIKGNAEDKNQELKDIHTKLLNTKVEEENKEAKSYLGMYMKKIIELHTLQIEEPTIPAKSLEDISIEGIKFLNEYHEAIK
ncbi:hypothetical protein [Bacillus cereus]|uniref:Lipoprotein n=1 Tax=Bacillus cereus TaxID=1396 RepID=A0A164KFX5_BACCE|nr:hypothetical protein [Bacillus cereus]KZD50198.1 hypothetical protein B4088_6395 [Bacillus cereus]